MKLEKEKYINVKPILRLLGSKYNKRKIIMDIFNFFNTNNFYEIFGGTGIISVKIKANFHNKNVYLNDFDNLFPLTKSKIIKNQTSYAGLGKYATTSAKKLFDKRLNNNFWEKVKIYNSWLAKINITHNNYKYLKINKNSFVYVDPPYVGREKVYTNSLNHNELYEYLEKIKSTNIILISYNDCQIIRNMYKNWFIYEIKYKYKGACAAKKQFTINELLICNKELEYFNK